MCVKERRRNREGGDNKVVARVGVMLRCPQPYGWKSSPAQLQAAFVR
jgi:hypothetical protein